MILKYLGISILVIGSAFAALALDLPVPSGKMQIFTDLQLADEVESLNDGQAAQVWIQDNEETASLEEPATDLKGISN